MSKEDDSKDIIEVNSYIVIQRHGYFKLHQLLDNSNVMLGKDKVDLRNVVGKPFWTMFKMVPAKNKSREFILEVCSKGDSSSDEILKAVSYGLDNRNITDDGKSQLLSSEDIHGMRESGLTGQEILEKLIENSTTFKDKTEYSQEKYLKKKGKKYFEYIIIRQPTLRLLSDIFYSRDQTKVMGLRHDTLSQIFTAANIRHDGVYVLFENGSQALVGAGILNSLSDKGLLINLALGSHPQKQAILSMNFKKEQLSRIVSVRIKELISFINTNSEENTNSLKIKASQETLSIVENQSDEPNSGDSKNSNGKSTSDGANDFILTETENVSETISEMKLEQIENQLEVDGKTSKLDNLSVKRKLEEVEECPTAKKPKWAEDLERAIDAFKNKRVDGIIIVAKEYPLNLITKLIPFLKPSCQMVVYCLFREPLVQLYLELKRRKDVIGLHLKENWLRMYQVLPDRTHPDVNMSFSGHLLTATKVL